jgi:hypothetical protein
MLAAVAGEMAVVVIDHRESATTARFATTFTTHLRVRGTDGSFVTFREVAHLTITATGVTVGFDRRRCFVRSTQPMARHGKGINGSPEWRDPA